jgi:hypothetical protein
MEKKVRLKTSKFFYTQEQNDELQNAMNSTEFKSDYEIARAFSEKFDKTVNAVFNKICGMRGKNVRGKIKVVAKTTKLKSAKVKKAKPVAKIEVIEEKLKPLTLPEGMTYQGNAKKVELHADHFRVYF